MRNLCKCCHKRNINKNRSICKCTKCLDSCLKSMKKHYLKNRESIIKHSQEYYAENKEYIKEYSRNHGKKLRIFRISKGICGVCGKNKINRDRSTSCCSTCLDYKKHKELRYNKNETTKARRKLYLNTHKNNNVEGRRASRRKYWEKNKDKWIKYSIDRRARKLHTEGQFTLDEWYNLLIKYGRRCLQCGSFKRIEKDHVVPLARGGNNTIDNIQPLCMKCNRGKSAKILDFRPFGSAILEWT